MTLPNLRITAGLAGALLLGVIACDAGEPEPEIELREGQTATFKTQSSDLSFKWKGCEPPWGDDPWMHAPTEEWTNDVGKSMDADLPAHTLGAWRDAEGGRQCDEGCASLDLAWTGDASLADTRPRIREVLAIGRCNDLDLAWSIDMSVSTSVVCSCG